MHHCLPLLQHLVRVFLNGRRRAGVRVKEVGAYTRA